jgi:hypothetical protein
MSQEQSWEPSDRGLTTTGAAEREKMQAADLKKIAGGGRDALQVSEGLHAYVDVDGQGGVWPRRFRGTGCCRLGRVSDLPAPCRIPVLLRPVN